MRKIFCAMLTLLLLPLAACKQNAGQTAETEQVLIGNWTVQVDMAEAVNQMVYEQTGAATVSVSFPVTLELLLSGDGTYRLKPDLKKMDAQIETLGTVLWQIVVDQAAAQSYMISSDAVKALNAQGKSKELLMQQLDIASMFENTYSETGVWMQESDTLFFAQNVEELKDAYGYVLTFSGEQFTLTYEDQETGIKSITFDKAK